MSEDRQTLLFEIGCEEIPSRMIPAATSELERRVVDILDRAGLAHAAAAAWGGPRRLAVRVDEVEARQTDREETMLGPPARIAFGEDGSPTKAALGFARKQGVDPASLRRLENDRGSYVGFTRLVQGRTVGELLAEQLPRAIAGMPFAKSMRWGEGTARWVRPVQWMTALFGERSLELELFGIEAAASSRGHRFLARGPVEIARPEDYPSALERAFVLIDPQVRRRRVADALTLAAEEHGGTPIQDPALLEEVADLVEWPGVFAGRFDKAFLDLPRELLITTLRHHQKCFSVQDGQGSLLPVFLAVANTDRDPEGNIRRGNEWVVGGRLEDARFFWREDRKTPLADLSSRLDGVVFHGKLGSYADKASRIAALARAIAEGVGSDPHHAETAARVCKNDLVTGTVGEFPELQGQVGGLLLAEEGADEGLWRGVYEHYRPAGPEDPVPSSLTGQVVSVADKLDSVARLMAAGEKASGSRDPLGLRRAGNGIVRVLLEGGWSLALGELVRLAEAEGEATEFLRDRLASVFRERGYTTKEILAVTRPRVDPAEALEWSVPDVAARLDAIKEVRGRRDFMNLVKLTERVDNILSKNEETIRGIVSSYTASTSRDDVPDAERRLVEMVERSAPQIASASERKCYDEVVECLSGFIDPVERFFMDCLVIDPDDPATTARRYALLVELNRLFTRYFDIRELAGEADGGTT